MTVGELRILVVLSHHDDAPAIVVIQKRLLGHDMICDHPTRISVVIQSLCILRSSKEALVIQMCPISAPLGVPIGQIYSWVTTSSLGKEDTIPHMAIPTCDKEAADSQEECDSRCKNDCHRCGTEERSIISVRIVAFVLCLVVQQDQILPNSTL